MLKQFAKPNPYGLFMNIKIEINNINRDLLKTEDDIRIEAKKHVDRLLTELGEKSAAKAWTTLKRMPFFEPQPNNKLAFIKNRGREYMNTASPDQRLKIEDLIVEAIKAM